MILLLTGVCDKLNGWWTVSRKKMQSKEKEGPSPVPMACFTAARTKYLFAAPYVTAPKGFAPADSTQGPWCVLLLTLRLICLRAVI